MYLLGSVKIPSSLVFLDCSCVGVTFASESPHAWQNVLVGWNLLPVEETEVAVIPLVDDLFLHGLSEVFSIRLSHGLMIVEYVRVTGCP
jgi:hypothetical protein